MFYSVIIPVFENPHTIPNLLDCLVQQDYKNFEVLIVDTCHSEDIERYSGWYKKQLDLQYFKSPETDGGFARNFGLSKARGHYFIMTGSGGILDHDYLSNLHEQLTHNYLDAFGGPERLHPASTAKQKAIHYVMTSFITTGGTRGHRFQVSRYYPRKFNMGFSKDVYRATRGFKLPCLGEDIELSRRIMEKGFKTGYFPEVPVYNERQNSFKTYFKRMHWFGRSRVNIYKNFPDTLKIIHLIPIGFMLYLGFIFAVAFVNIKFAFLVAIPLLVYLAIAFFDSLFRYKNLAVSFLTLIGIFVLMAGYSSGFVRQYIDQVLLKRDPFRKGKAENILPKTIQKEKV